MKRAGVIVLICAIWTFGGAARADLAIKGKT
jgi:hypothetical protein